MLVFQNLDGEDPRDFLLLLLFNRFEIAQSL